MKKINLPLTEEKIQDLTAGEIVSLSGQIFTARDQAHKRLWDLEKEGKPLPVDIQGATIYYAGPVVNGDITSIGPTTSKRMDSLTPFLLEKGLLGMIGKGERSEELTKSIADHGAVYFAAVGGAGAFYAKCISGFRCLAFADLGSEALYMLTVKDFPVLVAIDSKGNSVYNKIL